MNSTQPPLTHRNVGNISWSLTPEVPAQLLGDEGLRLADWVREGQAHVVKQGPHRIVYRVDLPGISFYLKHNRITDRLSWLRQLIRTSKARQEFESALAVAARGVPTVQPLALGEQNSLAGTGESYLITRSLDHTQPLNLFLTVGLHHLPEPRRTRVRHRLAVELGRFVARIHDAGVSHHDLHAANILLRIHDDDSIELYVIDLNDVEVGAPLDWLASRNNLVLLNNWFVLRVGRADRMRFWKAYFLTRRLGKWQRGPYGPKLHVRLALEVEKETWTSNFRFWRRRDHRCLKNNRYFRSISSPGLVGYAVTDLGPESIRMLLKDPDALLNHPEARLLKHSVSSTVAEIPLRVGGRVRQVIFKRFHITSWYDPLASLLRPTPALRSWIRGHGFRERSLPTARPLAVLHRTTMGLWREGYLLTEKLEHALELYEFVKSLQVLAIPQRIELLREKITEVARIIRQMHQRKLSHRDLKAANILVRRWDALPEELEEDHPYHPRNLLHMPASSVWLIDLVGVELFRRLRRRRKVQNLTRLNASFHESPYLTRTDRLRFLRIYLNWSLRGRGDWKTWWRHISLQTEAKVARNLRRGRPLG